MRVSLRGTALATYISHPIHQTAGSRTRVAQRKSPSRDPLLELRVTEGRRVVPRLLGGQSRCDGVPSAFTTSRRRARRDSESLRPGRDAAPLAARGYGSGTIDTSIMPRGAGSRDRHVEVRLRRAGDDRETSAASETKRSSSTALAHGNHSEAPSSRGDSHCPLPLPEARLTIPDKRSRALRASSFGFRLVRARHPCGRRSPFPDSILGDGPLVPRDHANVASRTKARLAAVLDFRRRGARECRGSPARARVSPRRWRSDSHSVPEPRGPDATCSRLGRLRTCGQAVRDQVRAHLRRNTPFMRALRRWRQRDAGLRVSVRGRVELPARRAVRSGSARGE